MALLFFRFKKCWILLDPRSESYVKDKLCAFLLLDEQKYLVSCMVFESEHNAESQQKWGTQSMSP